jgi:Domain of Unknown Function with PDB structure (DUF3857)/Transglutaminase-like superfamily
VFSPVRRVLLPVLFLSISSIPALAATWKQPTPDELKMTADPAAPDAPAVYLFREEIVDDKLHYHHLYAQIKVLTDKGKEQFSDIEIPYEAGVISVRSLEGRTIHPDGTVVPFTGKPYDKELVKSGTTTIKAKVFSMPEVTVGSIVEYEYDLQYDDNTVIAPDWDLQQSVFVHHAHYRFVPTNYDLGDISTKDEFGKGKNAFRLLYYPFLPQGYKVNASIDGTYDLVIDNIPALPEEDYSPPVSSFAYRLIFYYSSASTGADYWKGIGKEWSKYVDNFANPNDTIRQAVAGIVAPSDSEDQKLHKIYAAVMTVENTRFTREHTAAENKAQGLRVKSAADVWTQKRGTDDEIAYLFIAMARAAGFKAYAMGVTERQRAILNTGYLHWDQLEDQIAIVNIGGKEVFFDPGQRFCEYGKLHWMHADVVGIRETDNGIAPAMTPAGSYKDNETVRDADLELGPDGSLKGRLKISMKGVEALRWRQAVLRTDEQQAKTDFENEVQARVPDGVTVKMDHFVGLNDSDSGLLAIVNVSGNMGTAAGKRVVLPSSFFEARVKPLFSETKRENPVDLRYPWANEDRVTLKLDPGLSLEGLPTNADVPMQQLAAYSVHYKNDANTYAEDRVIAVGAARYKKEEYPELRDFFQKAGAQDQQQLVLKRAAVATSAGAAQ